MPMCLICTLHLYFIITQMINNSGHLVPVLEGGVVMSTRTSRQSKPLKNWISQGAVQHATVAFSPTTNLI